jgi:hypothetical protein
VVVSGQEEEEVGGERVGEGEGREEEEEEAVEDEEDEEDEEDDGDEEDEKEEALEAGVLADCGRKKGCIWISWLCFSIQVVQTL